MTYVQAPNIVATRIGDDDLVMMDINLASYFGMRNVAAQIWNLLQSPQSVDDLVTQLTTIYDVEPTQCRTEITGFLESLTSRHLVVKT